MMIDSSKNGRPFEKFSRLKVKWKVHVNISESFGAHNIDRPDWISNGIIHLPFGTVHYHCQHCQDENLKLVSLHIEPGQVAGGKV